MQNGCIDEMSNDGNITKSWKKFSKTHRQHRKTMHKGTCQNFQRQVTAVKEMVILRCMRTCAKHKKNQSTEACCKRENKLEMQEKQTKEIHK
jgi:hypothetical protein